MAEWQCLQIFLSVVVVYICTEGSLLLYILADSYKAVSLVTIWMAAHCGTIICIW